MKYLLSLLVCLLSVCRAAEEILDYQVEITVNPDTTLTIQEDISVRAEGDEIQRGIYRDFPIKYAGKSGFDYRVGFQVLEVQRDGEPEPYHLTPQGEFKRVYVGSRDTIIPPGDYTYALTYRTTRQLGFFEDQDELYYNAIGHRWDFPIRKGRVIIHFPEHFAGHPFELDVWTGPAGSTEKGASITRASGTTVVAELTAPLDEKEGMTVYVGWPKGLITPLSRLEEWEMLIEDEIAHNPYVRVAAVGLLVSFLSYFIFWILYGRDPEKGVIIPRYAPPEGVSPSASRYLMRMGYDSSCFAVSLLSLASRGWLRIHSPRKNKYELWKEGSQDRAVEPEETSVFTSLLGSRERLPLEQAHHQKLRSARNALKKSLKKRYLGSHFHSNGKCLFPGLAAIVLTVAAFAWVSKNPASIFLLVWLSFWTLGITALVKQVYTSWKTVFSSFHIFAVFKALFISAFSVPFLFAEVVVIGLFANQTSVVGTVLLLLQFPLLLGAIHLLKAPTMKGRKVMDELEGLKMYLGTAEVDRLHSMHPPKLTPEHFDDMLPYALALDVEQVWAEKFEAMLAGMDDPRAGNYHPHYYSGRSFTSMGAMSTALGGALVSSVSSASTAPGSSSGGGGGGSSGGGGGGGGGGGW